MLQSAYRATDKVFAKHRTLYLVVLPLFPPGLVNRRTHIKLPHFTFYDAAAIVHIPVRQTGNIYVLTKYFSVSLLHFDGPPAQ